MKVKIIFFICTILSSIFIPFNIYASSSIVELVIQGDSSVKNIIVSNNQNYIPSKTFVYDVGNPKLVWDLCFGVSVCVSGDHTVFVQYKDQQGSVLANLQKNFILVLPQKQIISPVITPKKIPGCTNILATNFNTLATEDNGSCLYPSESKPIVPTSSKIIAGCLDIHASNFNSLATSTDNSCVYPPKNNIQKYVAVVSSVTSLLGTIVLALSNSSFLGELYSFPLRLLEQALLFLGIRKKAKKWGIVFDSQTGQGLDPVYVTLFDFISKKEIVSTFTDIEGRYGFLVPPGTYYLSAKKTHYSFPALSGYTGESFIVKDEGVVAIDIPLTPIAFDWNEQEKNKSHKVSFITKYRNIISGLVYMLLFTTVLFSIYRFIVEPTLVNTLFFIINICFGLLQVIGYRKNFFGVVYDSNNMIMPYVILKFTLENQPDVLIKKITTDQLGRFYVLLKKGNYIVEISKKEKEQYVILDKKHIYLSSGVCSKDIVINTQ